MKLDQTGIEAILKTLYASAESLRKERAKWEDFPIWERILIIVMIALFVGSTVWFIVVHQIAPLLIVVGLFCIIVCFGINQSLSAMTSLRKESEEYQIAVDLLLEVIEHQFTTDDVTAWTASALATIQTYCNDSIPPEKWTVAQMLELDEFKMVYTLCNRLRNIDAVINKIKTEQQDVKNLVQKIETEETAKETQENLNQLFNSAMATLQNFGLYHPGMDPQAALLKAAELLKQSEETGAHIIPVDSKEDLSVKA